EAENARLPGGLEREPDATAQLGPPKRSLEGADVRLHPGEVVDVERGAVLACDFLRVASGDLQAAVAHLQPRPPPPRRRSRSVRGSRFRLAHPPSGSSLPQRTHGVYRWAEPRSRLSQNGSSALRFPG